MKIRTTGVSDKEMELVMDSMKPRRHFDNGSIQVAKLESFTIRQSRSGRLYFNGRYSIDGIWFSDSFILPSDKDNIEDCQEFQRFLLAFDEVYAEANLDDIKDDGLILHALVNKSCKVRMGVSQEGIELIADFIIDNDFEK